MNHFNGSDELGKSSKTAKTSKYLLYMEKEAEEKIISVGLVNGSRR